MPSLIDHTDTGKARHAMRRCPMVSTIALAVSLAIAGPLHAQTERVSVSSGGEEANLRSERPSISADGRFVTFTSRAFNLVPGDTNNVRDIFVHDREAGTTERVSVSSTGEQANGVSNNASISIDGRFIAFESLASNLVPGDTNNDRDVFVHDRKTGATEMVSVSSTGLQANGGSFSSSISANGRFVAFRSATSKLVPGVTNGTTDIFVHDRETGTTELVSVSSTGLQANGGSDSPSISADGRFVAFGSDASNLVPGDTNGAKDVFVHDRETGATEMVSVSSTGLQGNSNSWSPSLSADGRFVAFVSRATKFLGPGGTDGWWYVFVHDRETGTTELVSVSSTGLQANGGSRSPSISADGRFVAFGSSATNLVPDDTTGIGGRFVHDRETGTTERVSASSTGLQASGSSGSSSISADGRFVAFYSFASNLVPGDTNNTWDIFVHDREPGAHAIAGLDDIDGHAAPDVLALLPNIAGLSSLVVRDSLTKADNGALSLAEAAIALTGLNDLGGTPGPDVALLVPSTDNHHDSVEVLDVPTGDRLAKVALFGVDWRGRALTTLPDASDNGHDEIALLAETRDGLYARVNIRDTATIQDPATNFGIRTQRSLLLPMAPGSRYIALAGVPSVDGNTAPELAALRILPDGNLQLVVKDSRSGALITRRDIPADRNTPVGMTAVDLDTGAPAVAILMRRPDGRNVVQLRDAATGSWIDQFTILSTAWAARAIGALDPARPGESRFAVLGTDGTRSAVQVIDAATRRQVTWIGLE